MWLAQTPTALVLSSYARIPALEAEQSILTVNRISMASGNMKAEVAASLGQRWNALISGESAIAKPDPHVLRQHGFAVRTFQRPKVILTDGG